MIFAASRNFTLLAIACLPAPGLLTVPTTSAAQQPAREISAGQNDTSCETVSILQERISALINDPKYIGALWGIKILSLDTGKTLFEANPAKLCSPASNTKLYTVGLALDRLGPDYRIRTSLYALSKPDSSGTLEGDLLLYGRGDMTIKTRRGDGDIIKALQPLVASLTNAGLKRVQGDLICDQSFFRGPEYGSGWAWDDLEYYYGAEISALTINDNIIQATVRPGTRAGDPCAINLNPPTTFVSLINRTVTLKPGLQRHITLYRPLQENGVYVLGGMPTEAAPYSDEFTVHNPAALFGEFLRQALEQNGIEIQGRVRSVDWLERQASPLDLSKMIELGSVESLPLNEIARETLKVSQNLYTDLLLAHVGEVFRAPKDSPELTSEECGIRELKHFAAEAGIEPGEYYFEEGSGLSRDTLVTPNATVKMLVFMRRHKHAAVYLEALPVAGVDGTLRNRMKNTPAAGNVRAKTGSLHWASSLSGYVTSAAGERLVFSLMLNRYEAARGSSSREGLDAIATMLAGLKARTE